MNAHTNPAQAGHGLPATPPEQIEADYRKAMFYGDYPLGDREGLASLIRDVSSRLPADALPEVLGRALNALLQMGGERTLRDLLKSLQEPILAGAPDGLLPGMAQPIFALLAKNGDAATLGAHCGRALELSAAAGFIAQVNDRSAGRRRVVFVADQINYKVLREALYLRKRGCRTFLVGLTSYPPEVEAAHALAFDAKLALPGNLLVLGLLLDRLAPDIYHVHCNMGRYLQGRLVIERKGNAKVVCEYNDIGSIYADRDSMCREWGTAIVDGDIAMERFILHRADAFVHQWSPAIEPVLERMHGAMPPALQFQPYPCHEFLAYGDDKLSNEDGVIRFAYAGNPCPVASNTPGALFPGRYLPETVEALCGQGFAVDIFMDPSKADWFHDPEGRYALARQRCPRFQMRRGVAPHELPRLINRHDFGLIALKVEMAATLVRPEKWRLDMANKFFAYMEAGLPVLVNAESGYIAEMVEHHGVGVAVSSEELDTVGARLRQLDYAEMAANVKRFNTEHMMDRQIDRLVALYDRIGG